MKYHKNMLSVAWLATLLFIAPVMSFAGGKDIFNKLMHGTPQSDHPQSEMSRSFPPFVIEIKKSYYADKVQRAGMGMQMGMMPPEMQKQMEAAMQLTASKKFLVIEIQVTNTGDRSLGFVAQRVPAFVLRDREGRRYSSKAEASIQPGFGLLAGMSNGLNPGDTVAGNLVFDVAPGEYALVMSVGSLMATGSGEQLFSWTLTPQ